MALPEVNKEMLWQLESMGFPRARAFRALHYSGNSGIEEAINWVAEHENDPDIDQMPFVGVFSAAAVTPMYRERNMVRHVRKPVIGCGTILFDLLIQMVPIDIKIESGALTMEKMKARIQELRERALQKKYEEEERMEREREKERIPASKELQEAKISEKEQERKRALATRQAEKEEGKKAREGVCKRLEDDKAERRKRLGLPSENSGITKPTTPSLQERKSSLDKRPAASLEQLRECLRSLKQNHMHEDVKVKRAFQTLLVLVGNVVRNPDSEKFRKIRLGNPAFQERVGRMRGGIKFLELCGFKKIEGDKFLYLPRNKVDFAVLRSAQSVLTSASTNPYFGILSPKA